MPPPSQCRVRTSECRLGHGKLPDIPHLHTKSSRIQGALLLSHGIQDLWVLLQLHGAFQKRALQAPNACPPTWPGSAALRRRPAPAARLEARRRGTPAEAAGRPRWPSARWPRSARRGLRSAAREEPLAGRPVTLARRAPAWRRSGRPPARRCPRLLGGHTALVSGSKLLAGPSVALSRSARPCQRSSPREQMSQVHPTATVPILTATSATSRSLRNSAEANSLAVQSKETLKSRLQHPSLPPHSFQHHLQSSSSTARRKALTSLYENCLLPDTLRHSAHGPLPCTSRSALSSCAAKGKALPSCAHDLQGAFEPSILPDCHKHQLPIASQLTRGKLQGQAVLPAICLGQSPSKASPLAARSLALPAAAWKRTAARCPSAARWPSRSQARCARQGWHAPA